jgi:hypothetical protein
MLNPSNSLVRGAADAVLREVFGRRYGDLVLGQDTVLITHLIDFANEEHIDDLYRAAGRLQERIGPDSLADYVVAAEAEQAFSQRREEIEALVATGPNDRGLAEKPVYTDAHGRPTEYTPSEDDAYLHDRPSGGYDVCMGERFLGWFDGRWQAEQSVTEEMQRSGFFPNVWLQDDHGGLTLLDATEANFGRDPDRVLHARMVDATFGLEERDEPDLEVDL